jgi:hypothetical protein
MVAEELGGATAMGLSSSLQHNDPELSADGDEAIVVDSAGFAGDVLIASGPGRRRPQCGYRCGYH